MNKSALISKLTALALLLLLHQQCLDEGGQHEHRVHGPESKYGQINKQINIWQWAICLL